ncbi:unnamed protein product [Tetraodon nigroviridis]|uniref:Chromosome 5 SCAF14581, whole genome shotgun sequence n=1 Tax=Tetraodon nigroviridis TaxID=99883 RepID=Q4SI25_TETNG|nr:unnamed protein product [Tetraodon nigroviridis]
MASWSAMDRSVPGRERKGSGGPQRQEEMSERAEAGVRCNIRDDR